MNFDLLIKKAKEENITEIEIYSQHKKGLSISLFQSKVDKFTINDTTGLAIRGIYNNKMGYVSIENLDNSNIDFIISNLKDNASTITSNETSIIYEGSKHYEDIEDTSDQFLDIEPQHKIKMLIELEQKIKSLDKRITDVSNCSYEESKIETTIQNSNGLNLTKEEKYAFIYASCVAKDNGEVKSDGDYIITNNFKNINLDKLAENIVKNTISQFGGEPVESKRYPVIFKNEVMSDLLQVYQPIFSGESVIKNLTLLKDKIGQQVASEKITLIDDPLYKDSFIRTAFDDEGVACQTKEIITNGVLKTFLHNLKTAKKLGVESTGNGFKAGLNEPINVSCNNMYIKPGTTSFEDMIESTNEGLLITSLEGLHAGVDPVSGDFSLQASGFLIENSKLSRPVTLIVVAGNFLKMLNDIETIGNDLKFSYTQIGSPSIKIKSLQVSGK